jgi:tetratricopeptide (TPR) repeat protein
MITLIPLVTLSRQLLLKALGLSLLTLLTSCGSLQKMALGPAATMIYQASEEIETESNWELFKDAVPANLKLIEGLLSIHPNNRDLLVSALKAYVGYAFAVYETLHLEEQLSNARQRPHREQALRLYSKALKHGFHYLALEGIEYSVLMRSMREEGAIEALLEKNLRGKRLRDREAVMFTAQALGSVINLQREDMVMVGQLPVAKAMFDWVCAKDPGMNFGACPLFYGAYEAGRPAMLGGNPQLGLQYFERAIEAHPDNWLIAVGMIQFYVLPQYDEALYKKWRPKIRQWAQSFEREAQWRPPIGEPPAEVEPRLKLYRAIALKRFEIIQKYEKNLF